MGAEIAYFFAIYLNMRLHIPLLGLDICTPNLPMARSKYCGQIVKEATLFTINQLN